MAKTKALTKSTVVGEKAIFKFDKKGCEFQIFNRTGGDIYVDYGEDVDESCAKYPDNSCFIFINNKDVTGLSRYTDTISILPTATSIGGLCVQMINYLGG